MELPLIYNGTRKKHLVHQRVEGIKGGFLEEETLKRRLTSHRRLDKWLSQKTE